MPGFFDNPLGILWPTLVHLALIQFLFVMVSIRRQQAVRETKLEMDDLAQAGREPELSRRWARNLDNQFQVPMLYYALVAILIARQEVSVAQIVLAWIFVFGRIAHTIVQTRTDDVALRGQVFTINYAALSLMWLLFLTRSFGLMP
ncbi:MAG: MAPEG family protein [Pseudomonadota bacterium]